jgi:hypothetical protein
VKKIKSSLETREKLVNFLPDTKKSSSPKFNLQVIENYTPNECSWGDLVHYKKNLTKSDSILKRNSESMFDVLDDLGEVMEKKVKTTLETSEEDESYTRNE